MIPKIIHYCWFGRNPMSEMALRCIDSWKKYCPDYEIIAWNEDNFDINYNDYVKEAYNSQKWAFVSDVARLYALVNFGGIYMDTDVEVIHPLDSLLICEAVLGFESDAQISTGLMAASKGNKMFAEFLSDYDNQHFIRRDGSFDLTTNVTRVTNACFRYGFKPVDSLQVISGLTLFPKDYFSPKDLITKQIVKTENTLVVHHFDGSWHSDEDRYIEKLSKKWSYMPGGNYVAKFMGIIKYRGIGTAIRETRGWIFRRR